MTTGPQLDTGPPPPTPAEPAHAAEDVPPPATWRRVARIGLVMVVVVCWGAIALAAVGLIATIAGTTLSPLHAVFQMALPYVELTLAIPLLLAVFTRRRALAVTTGVLLVVAAVLVAPAALPGDAPPPSPDDVSVYVANVRYNNNTPDKKAEQVLSREEDVIVILELTPGFLELLDAGSIAATHPYRIVEPLWGAHGAGIFSSRPLADAHTEQIGELNAPAATVDTATGPLRIVAVHTRPPVSDEYVPVWKQDLTALRDYAATVTMPTMLAGDFNATRWHPGFRRILDLGLIDAHEQLGAGLTFSWPHGGRLGGVLSPFSRLDHALLFDTDATAVEDLPALGSDHLAFSVRVRPKPADTVNS